MSIKRAYGGWHAIKALCAMGLSTFVSGCTLPQYISVYNNTEQRILVEFSVDDKKETISIDAGAAENFKIGMLVDGDILHVSYKDRIHSYRVVDVSSAYWAYEGIGPFSRITYRMQYELDGKIYILPRGSSYPLSQGAEQPPDYPLLPIDGSVSYGSTTW